MNHLITNKNTLERRLFLKNGAVCSSVIHCVLRKSCSSGVVPDARPFAIYAICFFIYWLLVKVLEGVMSGHNYRIFKHVWKIKKNNEKFFRSLKGFIFSARHFLIPALILIFLLICPRLLFDETDETTDLSKGFIDSLFNDSLFDFSLTDLILADIYQSYCPTTQGVASECVVLWKCVLFS